MRYTVLALAIFGAICGVLGQDLEEISENDDVDMEEEEPVCAIPMCANFCPNGYADDDWGCMTCKCQEAPPGDHDQDVIYPEGCKQAMCRMFCVTGFQTGEDGCPICACNPVQDPLCALIDCAQGYRCREGECVTECPMLKCEACPSNRYFEDESGCQTCRCMPEEDVDNVVKCYMITDCELYCEFGYEVDTTGCRTCQCRSVFENLFENEDMCLDMICELDMSCQVRDGVRNCYAPTLCQRGIKSSYVDETYMIPHCEADGSFNPTQCVEGEGCWCVDDRGIEVPDTRWDEEQPASTCAKNVTKLMQIAFDLVHDLEEDDIADAIDDVKALLTETFGKWLGTDKENLIYVEVQESGPGIFMVNIMVLHDGRSDLPSAADNIHRHMIDGDCDIQYGDHTLVPQPDSVDVTHQYEHVPDPEPVTCWFPRYFGGHRHKRMLYIGLPAAGLILMLLIGITLMVRYRKRSASYQFSHKKLEQMDNFKKNLIMSTEWEKPELVCKDDIKVTIGEVEKKPLA